MTLVLWIIFFTFSVLSIIPVIKLDEVRTNKKYRVLWLLSLLVFMWTIVTGIYLSSDTAFSLYYSRLLVYPVIFLVSYFIFLTFQTYTRHQTPKVFHIIALITFIVEISLVLTNSSHGLYLNIKLTQDLTREVYDQAGRGILFYIHTLYCYIILMFGFVRMLLYLKKKEKKEGDIFPFPLILVSLILGISLNITHIFVFHFPIDPTYMFIVIVTFLLYTIIYKRDFAVNLILSSRKYLFDKMREMYVIADQNHIIIEYSKNLLNRFNHINLREGDTVREFYRKLKKQSVLYRDINDIKDLVFNPNKTYLHVDDQEFRIDRFTAYGELILLYDETLSVKMMHEIDVIRSQDQMTGVYNRNYFEEEHKQLEKEYPHLGVIIIDVDGLKLFNDYLGHRRGDELIINFSKHLLSLNHIYDDLLVIRFGGDEFLIVVKKADQQKVDDILKRIISLTQSDDPLENISFSYGYALRNRQELLHTLIKKADEKLYELKAKRKDYKINLVSALEEISTQRK